MNLDALVAPLRADVISGAAVVGRTAAEVVVRAVERAGSAGGDADGLREMLGRLVVRILEAQPAMAPLVSLGSRVLTAADGAEGPSAMREAVLEAARRFRDDLERGGREAARRAREALPERGRIVTLSDSSTVRAVLEARGSAEIEVVCLESRPVSEGRRTARRLARAGLSVVYAVDAAAWALTREADAVLVGADSIGDRGIVNKIGTRSVVEAARVAGIPAWAVSDRTKLLPPGFPQHTDDDRPADEVWRPPPGIAVWNRYFEAVPTGRFTGVITEEGVRDPRTVDEARAGIPVPDELVAWAEAARG